MKFYEALKLMQEDGKRFKYEGYIYYWTKEVGLATEFFKYTEIHAAMMGEGWELVEEPKKTKKVTLWSPVRREPSGNIYVYRYYQIDKDSKNSFMTSDAIIGWHSIEVEVEDVN